VIFEVFIFFDFVRVIIPLVNLINQRYQQITTIETNHNIYFLQKMQLKSPAKNNGA